MPINYPVLARAWRVEPRGTAWNHSFQSNLPGRSYSASHATTTGLEASFPGQVIKICTSNRYLQTHVHGGFFSQQNIEEEKKGASRMGEWTVAWDAQDGRCSALRQPGLRAGTGALGDLKWKERTHG